MSESTRDEKFEQVAHRLFPRCKLLRHWTLTGGISAQVTGLEMQLPDGQTQKAVLRQHGAVDRQNNPRVAAGEFRLLQRAKTAGIPVPAPYLLDESGAIFPTPYIVVEFIDGAPEFAPADWPDFIRQMAAVLAQIHSLDGSGLDFLPQLPVVIGETLRKRPTTLDESLDEGRIRAALEAVWPLAQVNKPGLLHDDFWPGNILWKDGQLQAVIDWEDALLGDPLADLANARLELLWAFGVEAMQDFSARYQSIMRALDFTHLAVWDLWAALSPAGKLGTWGLDAATESRMRERHKGFVAGALEKLNQA